MIHALAKTTLAASLLAMMPIAHGHAGTSTSSAAAPAAIASQDLITFSFEGGTASQLFAELAKEFPNFPVVLGKRAKDFEISGFEARISEPGTIVDLVCGMEGVLGNQEPGSLPIRGELAYRNVNQELVNITFMQTGFMNEQIKMVEVLSIQELLTSGMTIEEVMGTVTAGIELQSDKYTAASVQVRFHEETGVLFVRGSQSACRMISRTIEALTASAKWRVSPEAIAAKEALIKSEALDFLEETTKQQATIQQDRLKQLRKDHERLMEEQRKREDAKDAELERQLDEEFGKEDE